VTELLLSIGAIIITGLLAYFGGARRGRKDERAKQDRRNLDAMRDAKDVRDEIDRKSPDDLRRDLDGWMLDDD
jgi:hypothetical protein